MRSAAVLILVEAARAMSVGSLPSLQQAFPVVPPAEQLRRLADGAERMGVDCCDTYGAGAEWLSAFEREVAASVGKEAAMFVPSGTMAQQIALAVHGEVDAGGRRPPFVCHPSSHLRLWENDAHEKLLGCAAIEVGERHRPMTSADVVNGVAGTTAAGGAAPRVLILEVPHRELGGAMTPAEDVARMRAWCDAQTPPVKMHMDGARLYEALGGAMGPHREALLGAFDSIYVSLYKGLGGMTGALLCGDAAFVADARPWLRRFGGNLYNNMPYALSGVLARQASDDFDARFAWIERHVATISGLAGEKGLADRLRFMPEGVPQCCMTHVHLRYSAAELEAARDRAAEATGLRVFHRLRGASYLPAGDAGAAWEYFEWSVGPLNLAIEDGRVGEAWSAFLDALASGGAGA